MNSNIRVALPALFLLLLANAGFAASSAGTLDLSRVFFLAHVLTSVISAVAIIYLALRLKFGKHKSHKNIAYVMAAFGLAGLLSSFLYGIPLTLDGRGLHDVFGFLSLILSLAPIVLMFRKVKNLHCTFAYAAAIFAALSIISALLNYWNLLLFYLTGSF